MEHAINKSIDVHLHLNEYEAKWLKSIMQNPMFVDDPNKEEATDREMRAIFWNALKEI